MGEVYRAHDTRLNRDVALKVLPETFAADADRLARFRREAQVLAALNHPNIAAIYGFEDSGGTHALVLELVEGPTLADRVAKAKIPMTEALPIAKQIAQALEAAHEQGIIHRDLKPANIKLRDDGTVKVLDFGLAKAMEPVSVINPAFTQSPTITTPAQMTGVGTLLGTAAYMAPEQAKGRPADKRSDVWAFGCVLFEMLTGKRAFESEDVSDTLATVLKSEPDWSLLPADTAPTIRRLLQRCLAKNRQARIPDVAMVRFDLDDALSDPTVPVIAAPASVGPSRPRSRASRWLPLVATAIVSGVAAGTVIWVRLAPVAPRVLRLNMTPADGSPVGNFSSLWDVAITPDADRVLYATGQSPETLQLSVRGLDQLDATPLKGLRNPVAPFPSPNSQWVGYFEVGLNNFTLKKVSITGGLSVTICPAPPAALPGGASWGSDGTIVFAAGGTLLRVADGGGMPEVLTKADPTKGDVAITSPELLPGGRAVLFTLVPQTNRLENSRIAVRDLKTGQTRVLAGGHGSALRPVRTPGVCGRRNFAGRALRFGSPGGPGNGGTDRRPCRDESWKRRRHVCHRQQRHPRLPHG
jgi:serine/threonine-protein kinase